MKRATIIAFALLVVIGVANYFYYSNLFRKQIEYISGLLDRQVQIVGQEVDEFNLFFTSDLSKIDFSDDIGRFFDDAEINRRATERLKLYFIKYQEFITGISIINDRSDVFNISLDETKEGFRKGLFTNEDYWLMNTFQTHDQQKIYQQEAIIFEGEKYNYYQPILNSAGKVVANFRVSVDHNKYFSALFERFKTEQYQWQWLVTDEGEIIKDKFLEREAARDPDTRVVYQSIDRIVNDITEGSTGNIRHRVEVNGDSRTIISSYCPVSLLAGMDYGIVFSAPTDFFQTYIIRNSTAIVVSTFIVILIIILVFIWHFRKERSGMINARDAELLLDRLIDELPVGVIIYNTGREILKANKISAGFYSYDSETDMSGKIFPETYLSDDSDYFSKYLGGKFSPEQFVIIRREMGEMVLFRSSIPVKYHGDDATMEILIDVTMLESARKQEEKANVAKTEFLARMSYEIRTPLNGIIGMADMLSKYELEREPSEMVTILRRSTELLLGIINDILDFSSIESGRIILDEIPFDLHQELGICVDLANSRLDGKNVKITCNIEDSVPEVIIGDPFRLRQVMTNLTQFAILNTSSGMISIGCRQKSVKDGLITLEFDIRDTGKGHDKAELKTIFGDFLKTEVISAKAKESPGLGTVLAKQMIEIMGGKLMASSPSGLSDDECCPGTRILFTIHVYSNQRVPKTYDNSAVRSFSDIKALVITGLQSRDEDLLSMFHRKGIKTSVTTWNKSTINQIRANRQAASEGYNLLVLTDEEDISGFEVAGALKLHDLYSDYAIILISSVDMKGNYLKSINMGVDHYLVKPVGEEELTDALVQCFPLTGKNENSDLKHSVAELDILIAEDNHLNRKVMGKMLMNLGYMPDFAADGIEACKLTQDKRYDVVFMDLLMPGKDGYTAAREITSRPHPPLIIAFTADNMPESRRKAELSGIREFLSKPVRIEHLRSVLRKHFVDK